MLEAHWGPESRGDSSAASATSYRAGTALYPHISLRFGGRGWHVCPPLPALGGPPWIPDSPPGRCSTCRPELSTQKAASNTAWCSGGSRTTHSRCLHQQFVWASLPRHSADRGSKIQDSPVSRVSPAPGHAGKTQQKPPSSGRNQGSFKETKTRTYKADTNTSREHHRRATKHLAGAPALALRTTGCVTLGRARQLSGLQFSYF